MPLANDKFMENIVEVPEKRPSLRRAREESLGMYIPFSRAVLRIKRKKESLSRTFGQLTSERISISCQGASLGRDDRSYCGRSRNCVLKRLTTSSFLLLAILMRHKSVKSNGNQKFIALNAARYVINLPLYIAPYRSPLFKIQAMQRKRI